MGLPLHRALRILQQGQHAADVMDRGDGEEGWDCLFNHYRWWVDL